MGYIENELLKQDVFAAGDARSVGLLQDARLSTALTVALASQSFLAKELEMSRSIAMAFEHQDTLAKQFRVLDDLNAAHAWRESVGTLAVLDSMRAHDFLTPALIGPVADLKNLGFFEAPKDYLQELGINQEILSSFNARFCLPDLTETARIESIFRASEGAKAFAALAAPSLNVQRAMESMRSPWMEIANPTASASAFAAIQEMGSALSRVRAYDADLSSALRLELGDWRQPVDWPVAIFVDLEARSTFYASLGVNTALTNMPTPAFRETLGIANLWAPPPVLIERYKGNGLEEPEDGEEAGFARTNEAHNRLQRLESQLRKFIDDLMTLEAGPNWPKHRLNPAILAKWREKKERAQRHTDTDLPLIAYADFRDYEQVICRKDNWKIFEVYFERPEGIRESFQRLYPVRIDTMHSRLITQDDELFLLVECKRLMGAMSKRDKLPQP